MRSVASTNLAMFNWLVTLINSELIVPRILIFFTSARVLTDTYLYVTKKIGQKLGARSPVCAMFHKCTLQSLKTSIQESLDHDDGINRVLFCTKSLGMGIDMKCVDLVVHYGVPEDTATFLQETGRVGRNPGSQAHSLLIKYPGMLQGRSVSEAMKDFTTTDSCRRTVLLSEYGSEPDPSPLCCDNCDPTLQCIVTQYFDRMLQHSGEDSADSASDSIDSIADIEEFDFV